MNEIYNPALFAALVSWGVAQAIKIVLTGIKYRKFIPERMFGAGGMPSSHASTVCALAAVVLRLCGVNSIEFAFAVTLALIVMYDAAGVRRAAGIHAQEINKIREIVYDFEDEDNKIKKGGTTTGNKHKGWEYNQFVDIKKLKEYLGHTPVEVICGAVLGTIIGLLINLP